ARCAGRGRAGGHGGGGARRGGGAREPEGADAAWRERGHRRLFRMRLRTAPRTTTFLLALIVAGLVPRTTHAQAREMSPARAQALLARADSLMNAGRVFAAESIFYYLVRRDPRNPAVRLALGK